MESRLADGWQLLVDGLSQGLARLEVGHQLFRDGDLLAGARVAAHARRAPADRETAESADLDAVSARERVGHRIEHGLDRELGVTHRDLRKTLSELSNKIRSSHAVPKGESVERSAYRIRRCRSNLPKEIQGSA